MEQENMQCEVPGFAWYCWHIFGLAFTEAIYGSKMPCLAVRGKMICG